MQPIPIIDVREKSLVELLRQHGDKAINLIEASKSTFGRLSRLTSMIALPLGDRISKEWLIKSDNPYLSEIEEYASLLNTKGVFALNLCYEWGCTSGVYTQKENAILIRVLDWPFPRLGENIVVAHQKGQAGEFYNMTWPGLSGIFQAMAPSRFAASINQAPMQRHQFGFTLDWCKNRRHVFQNKSLPPAHLLRQVFERATSYEEAKTMLLESPVSIPVIYTLSGLTANEGCVIERLEKHACIREMQTTRVCTANHFESSLNGIGHGWLPRAIDSFGRATQAKTLEPDTELRWFSPPIANCLSRLVLQTNAATGQFSLMGTNGLQPVTPILQGK